MQAEAALAAARNSSAAGEAALNVAREGAKKAQQAADRLAAKLGEVRHTGIRVLWLVWDIGYRVLWLVD